jgi:hypothetical protein
MNGAIPPFPQYAFMAWCLVKVKMLYPVIFTGYEIILTNLTSTMHAALTHYQF